MKRARILGRRGELTPHDHRALDALLFQCGTPDTGARVVSYKALAKITGMARSTVAKAVTKLTSCGLLNRIKRRLHVTWHQGGTASLQAPNAYTFNVPTQADTESAPRTVNQTLEISFSSQSGSEDAQEARRHLAELAERRARERAAKRHQQVATAMQEGRFMGH